MMFDEVRQTLYLILFNGLAIVKSSAHELFI